MQFSVKTPLVGELVEHYLAHNETNSTINLLGPMDKNSAIVVSALIAFLGLLPSVAMSHSGGTNSSGCHQNSKTGDCHCHTPKSGSSSTSSRSSGFSSSASGFSGSSSGVSRSRGFSSYGSGGTRTYDRKSIPDLSNENNRIKLYQQTRS